MVTRALLVALAMGMLPWTPPVHADEDDALLARTDNLEAARAVVTVAILNYSSVCGGTVPVAVLESAGTKARAHGTALLRAVREKFVAPAIAADRERFCSETAAFIAGVEPLVEEK